MNLNFNISAIVQFMVFAANFISINGNSLLSIVMAALGLEIFLGLMAGFISSVLGNLGASHMGGATTHAGFSNLDDPVNAYLAAYGDQDDRDLL